MKTLLILSGDAEAREVAQRLKALGHDVVVCDPDPEAPAFAFADSCLIANLSAPMECAAAAERFSRKIRRIDGVLCLAEAPLAAATVTTRLRLSGLAMHVAELAADRLLMKRAFASAGVPSCWHAEIFTPQELQRAVIARERIMLKPVEAGIAGRMLTSADDLAGAFRQIQDASPSQRLMVEHHGETEEVAGFLRDGRCEAQRHGALLERAASAVGITDGPVVASIAGPEPIEITPRLGDVAFLEQTVRYALGE